jgi:hypothetical protein
MNISKQEANEALDQIDDAISQTRRAIGQGTSSAILILWGVIWVLGYSSSQFAPRMAQSLWLCLVVSGTLGSWICGARSRRRIQSSNGTRIGLFWLVLFAYAGLWFFLLHSDNRPGQPGFDFGTMTGPQSGAFFATVPMFAYVVGGLWLGRFFIWLGATVTFLTLIGYSLVPDWFCLWMAITGGGSLIVAGLYIRRFWRQAYGAA